MNWRRHAEQLHDQVAAPISPQGVVPGQDELEGPELISPDNNVPTAAASPNVGGHEESTRACRRSVRSPLEG